MKRKDKKKGGKNWRLRLRVWVAVRMTFSLATLRAWSFLSLDILRSARITSLSAWSIAPFQVAVDTFMPRSCF
jgi:hypothetical protein